MSPSARCAVHPVRAAVDACPICARARCAADAAAAPGGGCLVCGGGRTTTRPDRLPERVIRAALAATATALAGGYVASEYVGAPIFAYVMPFLVGVLTGAAAQAAAGGARGPAALAVRVTGCLYAVVGVGFGFSVEGSQPLAGTGALLPYAAAIAGVLLWTAPPRRAVRPAGRAG